MLNLDNVYNYYNTHLIAPKTNSRFNSHKKNDLKNVYNSMVKQNQHSPLYKFAFPDSTQAFAIGIKEAAMSLESESKSLGSHSDSVFEEFMAVSGNENVLYANLTGEAAEGLPDKLSIRVNSLATGQTNVGTYLPSGEASFSPGEYSFGIAVGRNQYTFNLAVRSGDTNLDIQRNLAAAINNNEIGVHASIRNNRVEGTSALVIQSDALGLEDGEDTVFQFDEAYLENDITSVLGIDHIEVAPSNAEFYINDTLHTSNSNRISLNHALDIDLLSTSDSEVPVYLVPDEKKITEKLEDFLSSYNQLVDIAKNGDDQRGATRLLRDIKSITNRHQEALSSAGFTIDENGHLNRSGEINSGEVRSLFDDELSSFRKDIKRMTQKMTLNPLDYIDKVVVTYPNTTGTYPNPYMASKYSGLLFNDYA